MGASKFKNRKIDHDKAVEEIKRDLDSWGIKVIDNGRENTAGDLPISLSNDPASKLLRFRPDLAFVFRSITFFADIKASDYIERDPYEHYMDLVEHYGARVLLISYLDRVKFAHIEAVEFYPAYHPIWPIVDDWISPRNHADYSSLKLNYDGKGTPYRGSGTDFRKFKLTNFIDWSMMNLCFDLEFA